MRSVSQENSAQWLTLCSYSSVAKEECEVDNQIKKNSLKHTYTHIYTHAHTRLSVTVIHPVIHNCNLQEPKK